MSRPVFILSAEGEDDLAEKLAEPIRKAGYTVAHQGTVLVGDSIHEDASRHLAAGAPVVVCATRNVIAFGLIYRLVNAVRAYPTVRLFAVRMEAGLYLDLITWGSQVAEYWQDSTKALDDLVKALKHYYPLHPSTLSHPTPDSGPARLRYLNYLAAMTRTLPLRGLDPKASDVEAKQDAAPCLTDVYITLETLPRQEPANGQKRKRAEPQLTEEQAKPVSVLTVFGQARRIMLLGDPGSGKSTFVSHLTHCLAQGQAAQEGAAPVWPEELPEAWRARLPVRVVLREMAAWLRDGRIKGEKVRLLKAYLRCALEESSHDEFAEPMWQQIKESNAILLLDGWDEVPNEGDTLLTLRGMLNALPTSFPDCPMLVTCRERSYAEEPWRLDGHLWPDFTLLEFDDDKIDEFVDAWYRQLSTLGRVQNWQHWASKLKTAVRRTDLRRMAGNPLLLTIMAIDHADKGELPDARSVVYEDVVDLLLWKWRQAKSEDDASLSLKDLLHQAGRQEIDFKRLLWQVAFEAHEGGASGDDGERTANISELTLRKHFAHMSETPDWGRADGLLRLMQFRTGLLIPSGSDSYTFPHRTFQEYLAACHLCSKGDVVKTAMELARRGAYWREVVLLAMNCLVYKSGDTSRPFDLVRRLCPSAAPPSDEESAWRQVALAGDCVLEIGTERAEGDDVALVAHVEDRLAALVSEGRLSVPERVNAGSTLSILGDPRDFSEMVTVPAGPFVIGAKGLPDAPRRVVELDAFSIRKYPVTEQEYETFVTVEGHPAPPHWRDNTAPADRRNHPVVNVSWEDAVAYCKWLSKDRGALYTLPTEAQWEKAARGTEGWEYPWGNEWDSDKCRCSLQTWGDAGDTSPVGSYPTGASPYRCLDMAGNVYEWCSDWYGSDYYKSAPKRNPKGPAKGNTRVLRGGSWYDVHPGDFRAADRIIVGPRVRSGFVGFRVALQGSD